MPAQKDPGRRFLEGGGEMGAKMRAHDWPHSALGPVESWPQSLRSAVSILLPSKAQIVLFWGPDLVTLYNDAYRPVFGAKHPKALGMPAREAWSEVWEPTLRQLFDGVLLTGEAFWGKDVPFTLERHGYPEETFFDVSYDPVRDESGCVAGIFCIVSDTTGRVIGERRLHTLRELGARASDARSASEALRLAVEVLAENRHDLPFAFLYPQDRSNVAGAPAAPAWPLDEVLRTGRHVAIDDVVARVGALPGGPWPEPPRSAVALPIGRAGQSAPHGFLVAGLSPRLRLDAGYLSFLQLIASQIGSALGSALAYEEERKRAEVLASLDRAKTTFFSNVSHEFRTPLTLILGPIEELLARPEVAEVPETAALLTVTRRNAKRLLKLVNTLLDFARIEAGRAQASYEATDLVLLTADLASNFRSACEQAGLELVVDCAPLQEPAYVDREMWEKIVLNLLSNAFKFTFTGRISVRLRGRATGVELSVSDTGTGIPEESLSSVFDRFHRVEGSRGRSHEGSGIGLALVQELVKLHGGSIAVESRPGEGSTFTVTLPRGRAHLPAPHVKTADGPAWPAATRADAYVSEALSWLPDADAAAPLEQPGPSGHRILLADDNADLREYARRLLAEHYEVETVADGRAALAAARARRPDLIVSDVLMPGLDGFGLIRELRADTELRTVPVVLLSARAGEEARMEGLGKGADAYLVKPFSARQLLVHVGSLLQSAEMRRAADRRKDEFLATLSHELRNPLAPLRSSLSLLRRAPNDDPATAHIHERMERQVNHLVRLVDDLLEMSRFSRDSFALRKERVELATIVRNAIETSDTLIQEGGHELRVLLPEEPLWLEGDPVRLSQILANLLNNSAKYTPHGGHISVHARREDDTAVISVLDDGAGIAPETLPRMFEMFSRGEPASEGGLGIGLPLARRLAEMHKGTVHARSDGPGKGSEFTVRIPLGADQASRATLEGPPPAAMPKKRILVVDDNRDGADSLGMMLQFLGAEVRIARDGPEALEAFPAYDPAVVLLDIGMPEMDGYEVARRLRERDPERRVVIVALTGWGQEEDRRLAREAGFDHHLVKPAEIEALQKLLASLEN